MLNTTDKIIKHKTGLLNLAEELGNVSKACQVMGMSRDTFYRYKSAVEEGGVEALFERTRRKPNLANRVDEATEQAVVKSATDFPAYGQARTSNELRKLGVFVSPSGVRSIWLRHHLANFKTRLKALEAKVAAEGGILTEAQVQALEKKKLDETKPAARSRRPTPAISAARTRSTSARSRAWGASISRPMSTPIARWRMPNSTPRKRRSRRLTCSMTGCCRSTRSTTCRCYGY